MSVDGHYAVVLLVDGDGRILLQERDEHAPRAPLQWGCVGGSVEPGETAEQGAYRELAEETGIVLSDELRHWVSPTLTWSDGVTGRYDVWAAPTTLTDDDIELGEGRQIVFVDPGRDRAARPLGVRHAPPRCVPGVRPLPRAGFSPRLTRRARRVTCCVVDGTA